MTAQNPQADLVVEGGWLIPVEPRGTVLTAHGVAIRDGQLVAVLPNADLANWEAGERLCLPQHALLPGLVNAHGHAAMSLLRGFADDLPLMPWLEEHIWPAETRPRQPPPLCATARELAMAEMLLSGTTTFSDMYFFPEEVALLSDETGLRCQLSFPVFEFPTAWGSGADDYISRGLALRDDCKRQPAGQVAFGPHAPYTV
jgi:5-methylthioadenosine/S-adenosylhomocysteine deaminase